MTDTVNVSNDEIDIREILVIIWKQRYWVAIFVAMICTATAIFVLNMKNIYESNAILKPQNFNSNQSALSSLDGLASITGINIPSGNVSSFDTLNTIVNDTSFICNFVRKNHFENKIIKNYAKISKSKEFNANINFYIKQALDNDLIFTQDTKTSLITLSYQNQDRFFCKKFVTALMKALSDEYRKKDIYNIQQHIDRYETEIDNISDITLKNKLASVVATLIRNKVVAHSHAYYGFDIIASPSIPESLNKIGPRRGLICVVAFFVSICISSIAILTMDSFKKMVN